MQPLFKMFRIFRLVWAREVLWVLFRGDTRSLGNGSHVSKVARNRRRASVETRRDIQLNTCIHRNTCA